MYRSCEPKHLVEELDRAPLLTLVEQDWWDTDPLSSDTDPSTVRFPFPLFRWHYQTKGGRQIMGYTIDAKGGELGIEGPSWFTLSRPANPGNIWVGAWVDRGANQNVVAAFLPKKNGEVEKVYAVDKEWPSPVGLDPPLEVAGVQLHIQMSFSIFYVEMGMPVAEVTPKGYLGGHVSWRKRRDYLTIVDSVHKANNPNLKTGATVTHTNAEIQRCAHHRRAHWRTLRAAKWGKNQGKRIFVKPTWVGPPEWKEGNQTYKIKEI